MPLNVCRQYQRSKRACLFDILLVASPNKDDFKFKGYANDPILLGVVARKPTEQYLNRGLTQVNETASELVFFKLAIWGVAEDMQHAAKSSV